MTLTYALLALALVIVALVLLAFALLGIGEWVRWLLAHGAAVAVLALAVAGGAALNTVVPRGCDADGVPVERRPITAALTSVGRCHRDGVAQVALVPIAAVAGSLVAVLLGPHPGSGRRDGDETVAHRPARRAGAATRL